MCLGPCCHILYCYIAFHFSVNSIMVWSLKTTATPVFLFLHLFSVFMNCCVLIGHHFCCSVSSSAQILDWFVQICLALKHVHDRKILHRDIKSQVFTHTGWSHSAFTPPVVDVSIHSSVPVFSEHISDQRRNRSVRRLWHSQGPEQVSVGFICTHLCKA